MRYAELFENDLTDRLAGLKQQRDALVHRWETTIKPQQSAHPGSEWWSDPEQGGLWNRQIYPLNLQIDDIEAEIKKQARVGMLRTKRDDAGFDTNETLYHGTDAEFEMFDRKKAHTALHIYTSPDLETADKYGKHVYALYGRQDPQAVLTAEDADYKLLRRIYRQGWLKRNYDLSYDDFVERVVDGELYGSNGRLQDDVIGACFGLKFRSVRISDGRPGGGYSDSVIFDDPADLQIVEKLA